MGARLRAGLELDANVAIVSQRSHLDLAAPTMITMANVGVLAGVRRLHRLLPEERRPAPVGFSPGLYAFVGLLAAASLVLAWATFQPVSDLLTLGIGAAVVFAAAYCAVRMTDEVDSLWTASVFVHLAMTFTFGPLGALAASVSQATAHGARMRPGWFRGVFNGANFYLTDLSAWAVFVTLSRLHQRRVVGRLFCHRGGCCRVHCQQQLARHGDRPRVPRRSQWLERLQAHDLLALSLQHRVRVGRLRRCASVRGCRQHRVHNNASSDHPAPRVPRPPGPPDQSPGAGARSARQRTRGAAPAGDRRQRC